MDQRKLLRRWTVLQNLKDEELQNISYVNISKDRAILIEGDTCNVYGLGQNNLTLNRHSKIPMTEEWPSGEEKVTIGRFSGLGIKKIVSGVSVVGGLARAGEAYGWIRPLEKQVDEDSVIMFERFEANVCCSICNGLSHCFVSHVAMGVALNVCPKSGAFPTYTVICPPPVGKPVTKFIKADDRGMVRCLNCLSICHSLIKLGTNEVKICARCKIIPEYGPSMIYNVLSEKDDVSTTEFTDVVDIACGNAFLTFLTNSNDLIIYGIMMDNPCSTAVHNPDQIIIKTIACGGEHLAVISSQGELYTCGYGGQGQLGYIPEDIDVLRLRKVHVDGVVIKAFCGLESTVCLTLDGTIYCFGSSMRLSQNGFLLVNQNKSYNIFKPTKLLDGEKFIDISNAPLTNKFYAQTKSLVYEWGYKPGELQSSYPRVVLGASSLMHALVGGPAAMSLEDSPLQKEEQPVPGLRQYDFAHLFGNRYMSDILLKLSDGDFPVHGLILSVKSAYFRDSVLKEGDTPPKELEMTSYNPLAYKALLKYFYQLPPEDLDCSDLVDLYLLATSYKETDIIADSFKRLKEKITEDTIKVVYNKAKAAHCEDLLRECETIMRLPKLQAKLLDALNQSMEKSMSLL